MIQYSYTNTSTCLPLKVSCPGKRNNAFIENMLCHYKQMSFNSTEVSFTLTWVTVYTYLSCSLHLFELQFTLTRVAVYTYSSCSLHLLELQFTLIWVAVYTYLSCSLHLFELQFTLIWVAFYTNLSYSLHLFELQFTLTWVAVYIRCTWSRIYGRVFCPPLSSRQHTQFYYRCHTSPHHPANTETCMYMNVSISIYLVSAVMPPSRVSIYHISLV